MTRILVALLAACALGFPAAAASLDDAPSAFVRAHTGSPVQWFPWGETAWARAKSEQKPIYIVVGSFTQELARAMREQSFAREETAAMLNESFIPVVVDRDEHPDLAAFLQTYVRTVKQMQGWPLNVWLTPELEPFEGASYLPPTDEWGKEGFPNALQRVLDAWRTAPEAQRAKAHEAIAALEDSAPTTPPDSVDADAVRSVLAEATSAWMATYDAANGGFGDPPRRLEPELLRFLLASEDTAAREAAMATLRAVATSPMRDPLDGGFFRSAIDAAWRGPTLQKALTDQARAALAYLEADIPGVANEALAFARSLASHASGYTAATDGTTDVVVPSFLWTVAEARGVLGNSGSAGVLKILGMSEAGNLPPDLYPGIDSAGRNLPHWTVLSPEHSAFDAVAKLRIARAKRPAPAHDSPATSGAHGLLLEALAVCGDSESKSAATGLASFIMKELVLPDGTLRASPVFTAHAGPRDYALVAGGLLAHSVATGDDAARSQALTLIAKADDLFWNAATGRYLASPPSLAPGVGVRVRFPAADPGDPPGPEPVMLLVLSRHGIGDPDTRAALAGAIVADVQDSFEPARGAQLLALQAWLASRQ